MRILMGIATLALCTACLAQQQGGAEPAGGDDDARRTTQTAADSSAAAERGSADRNGELERSGSEAVDGADAVDIDEAIDIDGEIEIDGEIDVESLPPVADEACFSSRQIRRFSPLTDEFVFLEGRRDEHYLLTMFPGCFGLRSSFEIALISRLDRVCSNSAASVGYRGVRSRETCPIQRVERVEDRASAERLVEIRSR